MLEILYQFFFRKFGKDIAKLSSAAMLGKHSISGQTFLHGMCETYKEGSIVLHVLKNRSIEGRSR